jgi:hypothetical protein
LRSGSASHGGRDRRVSSDVLHARLCDRCRVASSGIGAPPLEDAAVDLYWLPLGAGGYFVRLNGRMFEAVAARAARRPPSDLYHSALEVRIAAARFVIEQTPVRDIKLAGQTPGLRNSLRRKRAPRWRGPGLSLRTNTSTDVHRPEDFRSAPCKRASADPRPVLSRLIQGRRLMGARRDDSYHAVAALWRDRVSAVRVAAGSDPQQPDVGTYPHGRAWKPRLLHVLSPLWDSLRATASPSRCSCSRQAATGPRAARTSASQ